MMENIDDELEKYLKDSFDDFEVEPSETFWENLEEHLPTPERDWRKPLYLLLLLLLIGSVGKLFLGESKKTVLVTSAEDENAKTQTNNTQIPQASIKQQTKTLHNIAIEKSTQTSKKATISTNKMYSKATNGGLLEQETIKSVFETNKPNKYSQSKKASKPTKTQLVLTDLETKTIVHQKAQDSSLNTSDLVNNNSKSEAAMTEYFTIETKTTNIEKIIKNIEVNSEIALLQSKLFNAKLLYFVLPKPIFEVEKKAKKANPKLPLQFIIGTEISNTYQNIKVVNFSELPLLDVNAPAIFASQRRSVQFSVGVIKPTSDKANVRVNASLITLKQWTNYDTFSGVYKATNLGQNNYEITQVSSNYTETQIFKYLSLGINRQIFIKKTPAFRFFMSGGVGGLLPLGKQSAQYGFTASVGLQQKINEKLYFTIEPNVMYLLNKNTYDTNHLIQILPYTIGLKGNLVFGR
jgi:hypothetical protein